ncbi:MAG: hypothetical protein HN341_08565 [Verrucomicrobia bacterium]|nr:hypothetical protein [Verrucomicrobiota bacterium]
MKTKPVLMATAIAVVTSCGLNGDVLAAADHVAVSQKLALNESGISDAEMAAWVTSWQNPKSSSKLEFRTSFGPARVMARDRQKYQRSGAVPFRVTGDLLELKKSGTRTLYKRQTGSAKLVILDSDGKKVLSKSISLAKLCPS